MTEETGRETGTEARRSNLGDRLGWAAVALGLLILAFWAAYPLFRPDAEDQFSGTADLQPIGVPLPSVSGPGAPPPVSGLGDVSGPEGYAPPNSQPGNFRQ